MHEEVSFHSKFELVALFIFFFNKFSNFELKKQIGVYHQIMDYELIMLVCLHSCRANVIIVAFIAIS